MSPVRRPVYHNHCLSGTPYGVLRICNLTPSPLRARDFQLPFPATLEGVAGRIRMSKKASPYLERTNRPKGAVRWVRTAGLPAVPFQVLCSVRRHVPLIYRSGPGESTAASPTAYLPPERVSA